MRTTEDHPDGRLKGAILREFFCWYEDRVGHTTFVERFSRLDGSLDPEVRGCGVLASKWYDFADIHFYLDVLADAHPPKELRELVVQGTRASLSKTLGTLHRALIRGIATPSLHSRFAQLLWSTHYDTGEVQSRSTGKGEQRITYANWPSHHPVLCLMTSVSDEVIFPMMGLTGVEVRRVECVAKGASACSHVVTWSG